jgi:hypothetical protein
MTIANKIIISVATSVALGSCAFFLYHKAVTSLNPFLSYVVAAIVLLLSIAHFIWILRLPERRAKLALSIILVVCLIGAIALRKYWTTNLNLPARHYIDVR